MTSVSGERRRARLRDEVLDAATAVLGRGGWPRLRMQAVADEVGVSRRTLYNEFGSKPALAHALVARSTGHLTDVVAAAFTAAPDLDTGWADAAGRVLVEARRDPVMRAVLHETSSPDFLPLLTSEGSYAIEFSTRAMVAAARERWPELDRDRVALAAHATVRLVISYFLRSDGDDAAAAADIGTLVCCYLTAGPPGPARPA